MATEHTITAWIPYHHREVQVDVTFSYVPGHPGDKPDNDCPRPEIEFLKASAVTVCTLNDDQITELARNWLADEGYDLACDLAEEQRGAE